MRFGCFMWNMMLRTRSGVHRTHAIGYNAEARLLFLGVATLAVLESDLADLAGFVEHLDLTYGIYCSEESDPGMRQIYITPSHAGARELPYFPTEQLAERPATTTKKRRR